MNIQIGDVVITRIEEFYGVFMRGLMEVTGFRPLIRSGFYLNSEPDVECRPLSSPDPVIGPKNRHFYRPVLLRVIPPLELLAMTADGDTDLA